MDALRDPARVFDAGRCLEQDGELVAEGVETAEQIARLKELNCDLAQGSYFSEPLSAGEASDLLSNGHHW
ncbi:MAG: EAL domain-containing protein [Actinobacteria bacterium]|nr:EAL domain-containing protein [Actinomycetota bacterium]